MADILFYFKTIFLYCDFAHNYAYYYIYKLHNHTIMLDY